MDNMFESYINSLKQQLETLGLERLKLEAELGNTQGLLEDFNDKYQDEINERTEMGNEFAFIEKDVDGAYMNKAVLESHLEGLTDKINFPRELCEEEIWKLQSQISDMSVVLSMDNSRSLDVDGIIAEVNAQYEEIAHCGQARLRVCTRSRMRSCRHWLGSTGMTCVAGRWRTARTSMRMRSISV